MINFPAKNSNFIESSSYIQQSELSILTGSRKETTIHDSSDDISIYQADVYKVLFAFIAILSVLNALAVLVTRGPRLSFYGFIKSFVNSLFTFTTDHIRTKNSRSPIRTLQLTLLLSVTLTLLMYSASNCKNRAKFPSMKVYDSYKSLTDDPPDAIVIDKEIKVNARGRYRKSSAKFFLAQVEDKLIGWKAIFKETYFMASHISRMNNVVALTMSQEKRFELARGLLENSLEIEKIFIVEKQDLHPLIKMRQFIFSNSLMKKKGGKKLIKRAKMAMEHGLIMAVQHFHRTALISLDAFFDWVDKEDFVRGGFPPKKSAHNYKDINMNSFVVFFLISKWILLFAFVLIVFEVIGFRQSKLLLRRKTKIRPTLKNPSVRPSTR